MQVSTTWWLPGCVFIVSMVSVQALKVCSNDMEDKRGICGNALSELLDRLCSSYGFYGKRSAESVYGLRKISAANIYGHEKRAAMSLYDMNKRSGLGSYGHTKNSPGTLRKYISYTISYD